MIYKIRVVLDSKEDVIRTFLTDSVYSLKDLHYLIVKLFDFKTKEMASFYKSDKHWKQGDEIPLFSMEDDSNSLTMKDTTIEENMKMPNEKLIYIYDYLNLWTFYCELIEILENSEQKLPKLILSIGVLPTEVCEKKFKSEKQDEFVRFSDDDPDDDLDYSERFDDPDDEEF